MDYFLQDQLTEQQARALAAFVQANPHCHLFQHPDWAWIAGRTRPHQTLYFWGEEGGEIKVSALVRRMWLPGLGWAKDCVERGPVCADVELLREATGQLADMVRARGSVSLAVEPFWAQPEAAQVEADLAAFGFRQGSTHCGGQYSHTLVIDLTPTEDEIFSSFRKKTRYYLRMAEQMGVTVSPARDEADVEAFYQLYMHSAAVKGLEPLDWGFLMRLWQRFLADQTHGVCLMARYQGEVVSAEMVLKHDTRLEGHYGPSRLDRWPDLPKHYSCIWAAVKWAKAHGCAVYDLSGFVPDAPDGSPLARISQFKWGFSKTQVDLVRQHECVFDSTRDWVSSQAWRLRRRVLRAKRVLKKL